MQGMNELTESRINRSLRRTSAQRFFSRWLFTIFLGNILVGFYLSALVYLRMPLPLSTVNATAIVAVIFGFSCIVVANRLLKLPFFSFPVLFLLGTFLYTLSSFVLFIIEGRIAFASFRVIWEEELLLGLSAVMLAHSFFLTGCFVAYFRKPRESSVLIGYSSSVEAKRNIIRQLAIFIYIFCMVVILAFTIQGEGLNVVYQEGYSGNRQGFSDLRKLGQLSATFLAALYWFLPWSSILMLSTSRNSHEFKRSTVLNLLAAAVVLVSGTRTAPVVMLVMTVSIAYLLRIKISHRKLFVMTLALILIVILWSSVRSAGIRSWSTELFVAAVEEQVFNDTVTGTTYSLPFGTALAGFGSSYQTLMGTLHYVPEFEPYRYGKDYVQSIVGAVPFGGDTIGSFLGNSQKPTQWITRLLNPDGWTGLGYLQVAEAYLQFGVFGIVLLYVLAGLLLPIWWWKLEANPNPQTLSFISLVMFGVYVWIRNDSGGVPRVVLWAVILVYLIPTLLTRKQTKAYKRRSGGR